ncbi:MULTISPECIES: hypothetical protein [Thalassospira]|uniref:Helicase n=1 Tax=Thalassospira profundimaris TaxID=502049 RepID=A0A367V180_9PROT|nr:MULTISPECIES: hypothetical protein [Thalassospira]KZB73489.1 hypothetical protein AUQ43_17380 [Thalassospira sp. MCCC 1A01148]RCK18934.1 hypothetical protein TH6_20260 [Thalassospira profundimaris]
MKIIDNTTELLGDDVKGTIDQGSRLKIAASCFSIYAFEALKSELSKIESLQFIFTTPTFVPTEAAGRVRKEVKTFRHGWTGWGQSVSKRGSLSRSRPGLCKKNNTTSAWL